MQNIWQKCLEYATLSDLGLRRSNNQDSLAVMVAPRQQAWEEKGLILIVAEGMGPNPAGVLASKIAVETIPLADLKLQK